MNKISKEVKSELGEIQPSIELCIIKIYLDDSESEIELIGNEEIKQSISIYI